MMTLGAVLDMVLLDVFLVMLTVLLIDYQVLLEILFSLMLVLSFSDILSVCPLLALFCFVYMLLSFFLKFLC